MTKTAEKPAAWDGMHTFQVLDFLSNPMMIADHDMVIRYVNEAAFLMFERIEDGIRQDLPHFRARMWWARTSTCSTRTRPISVI